MFFFIDNKVSKLNIYIYIYQGEPPIYRISKKKTKALKKEYYLRVLTVNKIQKLVHVMSDPLITNYIKRQQNNSSTCTKVHQLHKSLPKMTRKEA